MMIIKVKNKDDNVGAVDVESWANPKTQIIDFVDEDGNSKPEYKDELEYLGLRNIDLVRKSHSARQKAKELLQEAKNKVEELIEKRSL